MVEKQPKWGKVKETRCKSYHPPKIEKYTTNNNNKCNISLLQ